MIATREKVSWICRERTKKGTELQRGGRIKNGCDVAEENVAKVEKDKFLKRERGRMMRGQAEERGSEGVKGRDNWMDRRMDGMKKRRLCCRLIRDIPRISALNCRFHRRIGQPKHSSTS